MRRPIPPGGPTGYAALLNLELQPHWTVFVSDFPLPVRDVRRLQRELKVAPTRPAFLRVDRGFSQITRSLKSIGIDRGSDYVSFHALLHKHRNSLDVACLLATASHRDIAKFELPVSGFRPRFASHLLDVVMKADYLEQEQIADRFFTLLSRKTPYTVTVETTAGELVVKDSQPWFDFSGRLRQGEVRILPAGEVSYAGERASGEFTVDGAILPFPEHPDLARLSARIGRLSRTMKKQPLHLKIRDGLVVELRGNGNAARELAGFFERDDRYRKVVEVGIAFNSASRRFIHEWPASSNEVHPGVHIGLGGDPSRNDDEYLRRGRLIHIDLMNANCRVTVNDQLFLRAGS